MCSYRIRKDCSVHHSNSCPPQGLCYNNYDTIVTHISFPFQLYCHCVVMWPLPRSQRGVVSVLWWCLLRENWPSRPTASLSASVQGQGSKFTSSQKPRQMLTHLDCSLHSALVSAILSRAQTLCYRHFCPPDILVTTPNRLVHMLSQQPPAIKLHKWVCYLCLIPKFPVLEFLSRNVTKRHTCM